MFCSRCHKNIAEYHVIARSHSPAEALCPSCYALYRAEHTQKEKGTEGGECPFCGQTWADYQKTGLVGCENCYVFFRKQLLPDIQRVQGCVKQVGRREENARYELAKEVRYLEQRIAHARETGHFSDVRRLEKEREKLTEVLFGAEEGTDGES